MSVTRIFAFSYAMGSASAYNDLKQKFEGTQIQICPVEYPGHGRRFLEEVLYSIQEIAQDMYAQISASLDGDYCLLGYSMGGTVCYELYQLIKQSGRKLPRHIFLLAADHPGEAPDYTDCENMPVQRVKDIFVEIGGTPDEILQSDEYIELLQPIAKGDLLASEKYVPTRSAVIECGVTLIRGTGEDNSRCRRGWDEFLASPCDYHELEGSHFFMFNSKEGLDAVCGIISKTLQ